MKQSISCRPGCGVCCEIVSISSPLPGMPGGKPAFRPCVNLDANTRRCLIWGTADYPAVCREFTAQLEYCGRNAEEARRLLASIEELTAP